MSARTLVHHEETPDSNDNDVQQSTELEDDEYMKINNTNPEPMEEPTTLNNVLSISVDETATTFTPNHMVCLEIYKNKLFIQKIISAITITHKCFDV